MLRCAILDDYQSCALGFADWSSLPDVEVTTFTDWISPDALAEECSAPLKLDLFSADAKE